MRNPTDVHERRLAHRLHVQLVLRRRQAHRLLQLGPEPGPRAPIPTRSSPAGPPMSGRATAARRRPPRPAWSSATTPPSAHPQAVDQTYITSWNNKQAPGYGDPATGQEFASVYRSNLLDENIKRYLSAGHGKLTLTDLINAMGNAGTEDLRGTEVLPYALTVLGHPSDPTLAHAIARAARPGLPPARIGSTASTRAPRAITTRAEPSGSWMPGGRCSSGPSSGRLLGSGLLAQLEARLPDQRPARPGHERQAPRLGLRRRLLRDRPEGPARRARLPRVRAAEPRLLRQRLAGRRAGRRCRARCAARSAESSDAGLSGR